MIRELIVFFVGIFTGAYIAYQEGKISSKLDFLGSYLDTFSAKLETQNQQLISIENTSYRDPNQDLKECKICFESSGLSYMLDCGHLPFCKRCSHRLLMDKFPRCPICRRYIKGRKRAFY